ncbi:preprotein translocase subunit SecG [Natranaerovirga pectinivora]|uniref:Protein-export membrane protein SecG n=1 Tax=Natranaerovirga pectinivora TaxID=682400 RepID=A0A4R3MT25_9FIRM|nr:preprotein translocase subunit SecG [Natranaerovirga pectinivora]TCT16194.1 preprotein translocase subunit SecG [Natranaerovirga pectinivora]
MQIFLQIVFILISLFLIGVVLMQKGKAQGLSGAFGGGSTGDSYWNKNKSRSMEGKLDRLTKIVSVLFFVVALALSLI